MQENWEKSHLNGEPNQHPKPLERVLDRLEGVKALQSGEFGAHCPAHDDDPSLFVREGDDAPVVLYCQAGCKTEDVLAAIGLTMRDLFATDNVRPLRTNRRIAEVYDYEDLAGYVLHQTVRYEPKDFRQRRPDGNGGYDWSLKGIEPVLYRLPEVTKAVSEGRTVFVFEGERDVDNARERLKVTATTAPMGADKWRDSYTRTLAGAHVVVVPDNDPAGRKHAASVAARLAPVAASVKVLELPGLPDKGDLTDWIEAGGTRDRLRELVRPSPPYEPAEPEPGAELLSTRTCTVEPEDIQWLWERRIPFGKLTMFDGDPDQGKSVVTIDSSARVSTGRGFPDGATCEAANVAIVNVEDGKADTIVPRLRAHGADLERVHIIDGVPDGRGGSRLLEIPKMSECWSGS